jgi:outer membrane protein assembly factor BamA
MRSKECPSGNEDFCLRSRHAKKITAGICLIFRGLFFEHNADIGQKDHLWMGTKEILHTCLSMVLFLSLFVGSVGHAASEDKEPDNVPADAPIISSILIEFSDLSGDKTELIKMARDLIFLKEGDRFSAAKLQKSLELLKLSESFREINVDSIEEEGDRIKLLFRLTPFRLIKDIKISGGHPLFERQILNTMTIYTSDAFIEEELHKQTAFIEELFQREGFPVPIVNVTDVPGRDNMSYVI